MEDEEERMVKADGLDEAILGTGGRINMDEVLIYSYDKCVQIFIDKDKMTSEDHRHHNRKPFFHSHCQSDVVM